LDRASDDQLAEAVDLHRIAICYVTNKKGGDNVKATLHEFTQRDHRRAGISFGIRAGIRTDLITGAIEMEAIQRVVDEAKPSWSSGDPFDRDRDAFDALRGIVATSAISHVLCRPSVGYSRIHTSFEPSRAYSCRIQCSHSYSTGDARRSRGGNPPYLSSLP
jgi:hypothetical protein